MTLRSMFMVAVCTTLTLPLGASAALARSTLIGSVPAPDATVVTEPIKQLNLRFSEPVRRGSITLEVRDASGRIMDGDGRLASTSDHVVLAIFNNPLPRGDYTVNWT